MTIKSAKVSCISVTTDEPTWNQRRRWSALHWEDHDGNWYRVTPEEAQELESAYQAYKASHPEAV
jgi:hypothetical protein